VLLRAQWLIMHALIVQLEKKKKLLQAFSASEYSEPEDGWPFLLGHARKQTRGATFKFQGFRITVALTVGARTVALQCRLLGPLPLPLAEDR